MGMDVDIVKCERSQPAGWYCMRLTSRGFDHGGPCALAPRWWMHFVLWWDSWRDSGKK